MRSHIAAAWASLADADECANLVSRTEQARKQSAHEAGGRKAEKKRHPA